MTAFIDLFSGIGGFALAAYWSGLRFDKHYFSEVDDYAIKLYQKRFPDAIPLGDIKNVDYSKLPKGEYLVTGGFPCQPNSNRVRKRRNKDERDLWSECFRMLCELRPRIAVFENVRGLLTVPGEKLKGEVFNRILSDIHRGGYDAEWQIISANQIGAPHKRERLWIVTYPSCKRLPAFNIFNNTNKKENIESSRDWSKLFSITAGAYKMENWEAHEQILTGTYDGLPEELDAIKGAGNAIVPQCAELIFNLPAFDYWRKINE